MGMERFGFAAMLLAISSIAAAEDTIKVGLIEPLSGPVAADGNAVVKGARLAAQEINAKGGVLGKQLELVTADSQCKPAETITGAQKLISVDKIVVLEGAFCSGATQALLPTAARFQIPLVTAVSTLSRLTEVDNQWFFRATEKDSMAAAALAQSLHEKLHFKTVFYLVNSDDYGRGMGASFKSALERLGAKTIGEEFFDIATTDFYPVLTKLRTAKPDLVVIASYTPSAVTFIKQVRELGIDSKIFGVGGMSTPTFLALSGEAANGVFIGTPYVVNAPGQANADFVQAFKAAYREEPSKYAMFGYLAVHIIGQAIERAGVAEPAAIRDALSKADYLGPTGPVRFDQKGQAYGFNLYLVELTTGGPVVHAAKEIDHGIAAQ